jgi:tripartite-type tricarboxylate transporter receptor subunit TctC
MRVLNLAAVIAIAFLPALPAARAAQTVFPEKPIRLVIVSAPGSGPDIISRALAEHLYRAWGQRVVVDARPLRRAPRTARTGFGQGRWIGSA